ncbi:hypothetical protein SAMN04515668_1500 [Hymenobacter arizonensis]|uniref:Uncharacterized protein n=1 Tax=Hymenobacter arizonensis TaxID=1227077 RepID=A0A1I5WUZ6_HYMAR|nr:hypothetical protein SAMN04515668_1500 [Hymenobacter arizonensis]
MGRNPRRHLVRMCPVSPPFSASRTQRRVLVQFGFSPVIASRDGPGVPVPPGTRWALTDDASTRLALSSLLQDVRKRAPV